MKTNAAGIEFIKRWEGLRLEAYQCSAGVWTIGYGHTGDVKRGDRITAHQAEAILEVDLDKFERGVAELSQGVALTENQFAALVAFSFNVGLTAFSKSALLRKLKAYDTTGAAAEFAKWIHAGGRVLPGLVKRRAAEAELFARAA